VAGAAGSDPAVLTPDATGLYVVTGDGFAQAEDSVVAIVRKVGSAAQVAAEGVDGYRVGLVDTANEVSDGVLGVNEAPVHEVAGIKQKEDVGADQ